MSKQATRRRSIPVLSLLSLALLGASSMPAFAAEPACLDTNGNPSGETTTQGQEHGSQNTTCAAASAAYGIENNASAFFSAAFGLRNTANGSWSSAFGRDNVASGYGSSAFGSDSQAGGTSSSAFGFDNRANGNASSAFGAMNTASANYSSAMGYRNTASGLGSNAFGFGNTASGDRSSAFGYGSKALNVGSTAIGYQAVADRDYAVSVGATGAEHQIIHVADGTEATDAVNVRQMQAGDAQTLAASKAYTDSKFAAWNDSFLTQFQQQTDVRFAKTDKRIDQIGAMGSAMTHMAVNAANGSSAKGRIAIGVGAQGSQGAVSIGYGKRLGDRGSFSLGASFSSGESSAGAGVGFDL